MNDSQFPSPSSLEPGPHRARTQLFTAFNGLDTSHRAGRQRWKSQKICRTFDGDFMGIFWVLFVFFMKNNVFFLGWYFMFILFDGYLMRNLWTTPPRPVDWWGYRILW